MPSTKEFINQRVRWSSNSKSNASQNPIFFYFLITMFIYNILTLGSFLFSGPWILLLSMKFVLEGIVIFLGGRLYNRKFEFIPYCLWAIVQPLYIPVLGILGLRGKFVWKP